MAKLTAKARKAIPKKDFAEPDSRGYPIQDLSHAKNALARSSGKPEEAAVKKAVYKKYPELNPGNKVPNKMPKKAIVIVAIPKGKAMPKKKGK